MDDVDRIVSQTLMGASFDSDPQERERRAAAISRLFAFYRQLNESDFEQRLTVYLLETDEIPVDFLVLAVRLALRTHRYPSLPAIADLWSLARAAAGMDREQYRAGRYLPPSRNWPPAGYRHAVTAGELEPIATWNQPQLAASARPMLTGGEDR